MTRLQLAAAASAAALLAGCGGGGANGTAPPVRQGQAPASAIAGTVDGTHGLIGPALRATQKHQGAPGLAGSPRIREKHAPRQRGAGVVGEASCADSGLMPAAGEEARLASAIVCLLNAQRAAAGLPSLSPEARLAQAAGGMATQMVRLKFFSHTEPDGTGLVDRVRPTGYMPSVGDWVLGENLAWGSGALSTPAAIVTGWMNSPEHKANVLAPDYRDVGLGVEMGSPTSKYSGGTVYVADFGRRTAATAAESGGSSGSTGAGGSTSDAIAARRLTMSIPRSLTPTTTAVARGRVGLPIRCKRRCVVSARVYYHHRRVGSGHRHLRRRGKTTLWLHLARRVRHLHHARLTAVTRVRGKHGTHHSTLRLR